MELHHKRSLIVLISSALLTGLFFLTWYQFTKEARIIINKVILTDITQLKSIFDRINSECGILGFDHEKNYIDFLTVKSFVSSEIGSMNLVAPEKWQGPYVQDNPTIQSKKYEIVRTKNGYYIVPGTGVQLSNGKMMGKDIIISPDTALEKLTVELDGLTYQGKRLFAPITMHNKALIVDIEQEDE
ncbi:MAG: hypothetical protein K2X90_02330 [Candidatus Babeliaceae bacterium]|nr:hypothetical protein [Candidatus Babeliaceae bacterium]